MTHRASKRIDLCPAVQDFDPATVHQMFQRRRRLFRIGRATTRRFHPRQMHLIAAIEFQRVAGHDARHPPLPTLRKPVEHTPIAAAHQHRRKDGEQDGANAPHVRCAPGFSKPGLPRFTRQG